MRPGRHGGMSSSELEMILARNGNFLSVRRAGSGDGFASLHNGITGEFILGINGGWLPEYSRMQQPQYDCACTPGGHCRSGQHGIALMRGWRNVLFELVARGRVHVSKEVRSILGEYESRDAKDYGLVAAPMGDPSPSWQYSGIRGAA